MTVTPQPKPQVGPGAFEDKLTPAEEKRVTAALNIGAAQQPQDFDIDSMKYKAVERTASPFYPAPVEMFASLEARITEMEHAVLAAFSHEGTHHFAFKLWVDGVEKRTQERALSIKAALKNFREGPDAPQAVPPTADSEGGEV